MTTIGSTPETTTVYGMPADRAAAVDEVHARPHPLLQLAATAALDLDREGQGQAGKSSTEAIQAAKSVGAFSGEPLRSNLINQLNHWGFHKWLGLTDSADLFSTSRHLVQTTSLLRYPVFVKDDDYRGSPDMTKHPLLRKYLLENFAAEVEELKNAVFVGLGPQVQKVLDRLIPERILKPDRVIGGMLHPSGNCTYRINYLIGDRSAPVPHATNPVPYDQGRRAFRERFVTA